MTLIRTRLISTFCFSLSLLLLSSPLIALECKNIRQMTDYYLRMHFSVHDFSEEISSRTFDNFIRYWDPGKVYFLDEDISYFRKKFAKKFPIMIRKDNCSAIDAIFNRYSVRFDERQPIITELIDTKHNFALNEFLTIDRKTLPYAKDATEIRERWRKRIKFQHLNLMSTISNPKTLREKLKKRYSLAMKRQKDLTTEDVYGAFMDAFSTALDPHTDYFSPAQLEEFRISTRLSLEGIGALLRSDDGVVTIENLVPGGAAQKGGLLKVGDKVVAVSRGGNSSPVDVIDMALKDVVQLIRGPGGTEVRLTVRRDSREQVIPIIREKIQLKDRAAKSKIYPVDVSHSKDPGTYKIGVIDLPSFYMDFEGRQTNKRNFRSSSKDMAEEINKLKKSNIDCIIVDLRSNGGGSLDEAINVAGIFSGSAPVVQIKGNATPPYVSRFDGKSIYDGLLVLLIDRQSASASEILAGAIQDYGRGILVGDSHTFGKGTVQNLNDLDPKLGAIKITISKFYRPSGASTQLRGVDADIILPSLFDHYEIGEKHYDFALPWEKVDAVQSPQFNLVKPYLSELKLASMSRIKHDKKFIEVHEAIDKFVSEKEERMRVSLKEPGKEEKEKEEKEKKELEEKKKKLEKDNYGNYIPSLEDDIYLQEAIRIATDYVRLHKKLPIGPHKIKALKVSQASSEAAPAKNMKTTAPAKKK
ncbi:MAG: carboxy terminal-processing peptidase [Deltaproteobacteria bacterium]|nr:carboxy terminal-processing peptidase [Deltaproteobacteria bacterium]